MWIPVLFTGLLALQAPPTDLGPYLMEQAREIALARSAAPPGVGSDAEVWILERSGFRRVVEGSNGFACVVQRSFNGGLRPDAPDESVWNPRVRAPICFNQRARSVFERQLDRTRRLLSGTTVKEVLAETARRGAQGTLRLPEHGAMAYMLSSGQYLGDTVKQGVPHVMFYEPFARAEDFGGRDAGQVAFVLSGGGTFESVVVVPVPEFVAFDFENER